MDSPSSNYIIGSSEKTPQRRRFNSRAKLSPKTPTHPSNGYEVMDSDTQPARSVKMSPLEIKYVRSSNTKLEANGGTSFSTNNRHNRYASPDIKHLPSPQDCGDVVAVSQESTPEVLIEASSQRNESNVDAAISQEDNLDTINASQHNIDTPSKGKPKRSAHKSMTDASEKSVRRRSLRLLSKPAELLTPQKKMPPSSTSAREPDGPTSGNGGSELPDLAMMEDRNSESSKVSAIRRSPRIRRKSMGGISAQISSSSVGSAKKSKAERKSPSMKSAKKSPTKRKRRSSAVFEFTGDDEDAMPSPKRLLLKETVDSAKKLFDIVLTPPKMLSLQGETPPMDRASFHIGMSENGHLKLVQALEKIAIDVVIGPSSFDNVSKRKNLSGRCRSRKRRRQPQASALKSMSGNENALNASTKKEIPKNRRDTFDLSKKRGLTSTPKRLEDLNLFIDKDLPLEEEASPDYVTPKAGSTVVNIRSFVNEMSRTLDDDPKEGIEHDKEEGAESMELSAVKNNLQNLTSIGIEDKMRQLFPQKVTQLYKYPCVSARIFAAMSSVYEDQATFSPLLPFILSLVNAEIVSLINQEDSEPCFINKKVCFSGFDYSSTTTALGEVVGQGGGDLRPSIEALEAVLQQALKLSRPAHHLDVAIECLQCMASYGDASDACAKTMVGYFPSARFEKAHKHYLEELKDVKRFLLSQHAESSGHHMGIRYRLNDFIGRSVRYHLRELLNTIPESVVYFDVEECEERWGRAVDDRSISSILNFSLEKIHELLMSRPDFFNHSAGQSLPDFFTSEASRNVHLLSLHGRKNIDKSTYEDLVVDITEARAFLFGARACKFVLELLQCPGVEDHINALGGWSSVEAIASTFYNLNLHEGSENQHFVQLKGVQNLVNLLENVNHKLEEKIEHCEFCMRRLRRTFNIKVNPRSIVHNLKDHLVAEKAEYFPMVVVME